MSEPVLMQKGSFRLDEALFDGYASEDREGIIIGFIASKQQGKGHFSALIKAYKERYAWIKIPTPSNQMRAICLHLGFRERAELFPFPFEEIGTVMYWKKENGGETL